MNKAEWDKKFIVNRQGKDFVLYAGLLDLAHSKGLAGIETKLIQIPTPENKGVAIVQAWAHFTPEGPGEMKPTLSYSGIGDAASNNVAPAMQTVLIRMAETRAKARALRDGVNIGTAAFEELGDNAEAEDTVDSRQEEGEYARNAIRSARRATSSKTADIPAAMPEPVPAEERRFTKEELEAAKKPADNPAQVAKPDEAANTPSSLKAAAKSNTPALIAEFWRQAGRFGIDRDQLTTAGKKEFFEALWDGTPPTGQMTDELWRETYKHLALFLYEFDRAAAIRKDKTHKQGHEPVPEGMIHNFCLKVFGRVPAEFLTLYPRSWWIALAYALNHTKDWSPTTEEQRKRIEGTDQVYNSDLFKRGEVLKVAAEQMGDIK